ncbi:MAG: DUF2218 domain-containing protein [Kiloniellaceae bacterium]
MTRYRASVATGHASRYLQQLCKHWSHRLEVAFDTSQGVVRFDGADCRLHAETGHLHMALEGDDPARLRKLCDVVADHLKRFAFREELNIAWSEAPAATAAVD